MFTLGVLYVWIWLSLETFKPLSTEIQNKDEQYKPRTFDSRRTEFRICVVGHSGSSSFQTSYLERVLVWGWLFCSDLIPYKSLQKLYLKFPFTQDVTTTRLFWRTCVTGLLTRFLLKEQRRWLGWRIFEQESLNTVSSVCSCFSF